MSSLITQLESKINANQQRTVSKLNKNHNKPSAVGFCIAIPTSGLLGGLIGIEVFEKDKSSYKNEIIQAEQNYKKYEGLPLFKKEFDFRNNVLTELSDKALALKEGQPREMPNCLMVQGKNLQYCEKIIDWIGKTSNCNFIKIQNGDGIVTWLEKNEKYYKKTGDWSLLYIKNMDELINYNKVDGSMIAYMKDIMSAAAEDYHTTLIFSTDDPSKLDKIALQPHRVKKKFNIDEINESRFWNNEDKITKLDENYNRFKTLIENNPFTKKLRNSKIKKFVAIGLAIGTVVAATIGLIHNKINKKHSNTYFGESA